MEKIAAYCSWADKTLLDDTVLCQALPPSLLRLIQTATGEQYLQVLAEAALTTSCTDRFVLLYRPLLPEIVSRWAQIPSRDPFQRDIQIFSSIVRVLPLAHFLRPHLKALFAESQIFRRFSNISIVSINLSEQQLLDLLLAYFRLLSYDPDSFTDAVNPSLLSALLRHDSIVVRYLAVECLTLFVRFADALAQKLIETYVGKKAVWGDWEGKKIDYRLLKLWEERRWQSLEEGWRLVDAYELDEANSVLKKVTTEDLSPTTAVVGGVLLLRPSRLPSEISTFVITATSYENLGCFAQALLQTKPILLTGASGSGKTSVVFEAARTLDKLSTMVTLHLNEQTDAKTLLGVYASSQSGSSFEWQPGVLTKAMQEGRWVLIEDIDRAPADVLSVIRPIIKRGKLYLPNRKQYLKAAEGFRIIATTRLSRESIMSMLARSSSLATEQVWTLITLSTLKDDEIEIIVRACFPSLDNLISTILGVHKSLVQGYIGNQVLRSTQSRLPTLRDVLKCCARILQRLVDTQGHRGDFVVRDNTSTDIFKDVIDCYLGYISDQSLRDHIAGQVAQNLNISPQQAQFCLNSEVPKYSETEGYVAIGRASMQKFVQSNRKRSKQNNIFANTRTALKAMESIAAGSELREAILLVGETGIGKTALVQNLASAVGQKLTVVNLSQQSEASDLLGGLKPVTSRSLIMPMIEIFEVLFNDTFSAKRNVQFQSAVNKCIATKNWQRLVLLWQEALQMAQSALQIPVEEGSQDAEASRKRRKLANPKYEVLRKQWTDFAERLSKLRSHISRTDTNSFFTFMEGRLVQAVRNGEWLLLDEINLASPDTLDHISSLIQVEANNQPYLLLTESGSVDRVTAHPNFRVFAAMNPATDTGKKDLSPGLRSRFTELYIPSGDSNETDLVNLIEAYLNNLLDSDRHAAQRLARLYLEVKKLNEANQLTDGAGEAPHFSVRSLVRCLQYAMQHTHLYGLRRAIFEGFAMSFTTALSGESGNLVHTLASKHIFIGVKNVRSVLAQKPKLPTSDDCFWVYGGQIVLRGPLPRDPVMNYILTPSVERNLTSLARATSMRQFPILLQGPTSSGKTSMVEYLAKTTGNHFVRINNHEHTDLQEYLGSYVSGDDGKLYFREGVLVDALRQGHWIVLDELNLAPTDVLEALNRLLDDNRELLIPETQEIVRPHPNFLLFATQNPAGLYGGRKRLSRALRNRFLELHFGEIPDEELGVILQRRSQIPPSFCANIVSVYKRLSLQRQSARLFEQRHSFATLRDLFRWASRSAGDRLQLAQNGFMLLAERVRDASERNVVREAIEHVMKVQIHEDELYGLAKLSPSVADASEIIWTPAMRRLFVLVSKALENNEPVILVGETGCGKTQICQTIARALGRNINIYNAHTNTETGDLIGSQRPIRNRSETESRLLESLLRILPDSPGRSIVELVEQFQRMDYSTVDHELVMSIKTDIAQHQSLFQWIDGSLVRSLRRGEVFLLDEISLAEDSVLERLNSVLEPARTILLAEKGSQDNIVSAAPGFQFLATMNPGGDYGKRELSAALRNRLTEIWVPPLRQRDDVLPILRSRLGADRGNLAEVMLDFAVWFESLHQNSENFSVPLRTLLSWVQFVNTATSLSPQEMFIHGAAMVFIDSLGANPAGIMAISVHNIQLSRRACFEKLSQLVKFDALAVYERHLRLEVHSGEIMLGGFVLNRVESQARQPDLVFNAPSTLQNTMRLMRALQLNKPVLLEGSPGVGKTAIVSALAQLAGKDFTRVNLSDQTDLMDLFGADVPNVNESLGSFSWHSGPLLRAMQSGGWVLIDEMNLASQSVLEGLNSCLDHRHEVYISELDKTFTCHPDFVLFAAQNPSHQGGGRKGLPASFVNRFTVVYVDTLGEADLYQICQARYPDFPKEKLQAVLASMSYLKDKTDTHHSFRAGGPWDLNLRDTNRWLEMLATHDTIDPYQHYLSVVQSRFRNTAQKSIATQVYEDFFGRAQHDSLYHNLSPEALQIGCNFLKRHPLMQNVPAPAHGLANHHLRAASSVIAAVNQGWPVVLTGPAGSGRTTLVRQLAALSGAQLVEMSLNSETDTMDLIGGYEQHDPLRNANIFKQNLFRFLHQYLSTHLTSQVELQEHEVILQLLATCTTDCDILSLKEELENITSRSPIFASFLDDVKHAQNHTAGEMKFEWVDGILIDAIREGSWLVLENANSCNASVLDRLNSLLEPNGRLTISEQHGTANSERTIKPHPDFRIFLTVDPRYGELSRAMRNRSLEVHFEAADSIFQNATTVRFYSTSSTYRMRGFDNHDGLSDDQMLLSGIAAARLDRLSVYDSELLNSVVCESASNVISQCLKDQSAARLKIPPNLSQQIAGFFDTSVGPGMPRAQFQSSMPSMNEPLVNMLDDRALREQAQWLTSIHKLWLDLEGLKISILQASERMAILTPANMNLLQRSMHSRTSHTNNPPPFSTFFSSLTYALSQYLAKLLGTGVSSLSSLNAIKDVLNFARDVYNFCGATTLSIGRLQAYLQIGEDLAKTLHNKEANVAEILSQSCYAFNNDFGFCFGRSLQQMWDRWRPVTPKDELQLDALIKVEKLIARFDNVAQNYDVRSSDLATLRTSLTQIQAATLRDEQIPQSLVQVINNALEHLQSSASEKRLRSPSYLCRSFEMMYQIFQLRDLDQPGPDLELFSLLAGRDTMTIEGSASQSPVPRMLAQIARFAGYGSNHADISDSEETWSVHLVKELANCLSLPLNEFYQAEQRVALLVENLASYSLSLEVDSLCKIRTTVEKLVFQILHCHEDLLSAKLLELLGSSEIAKKSTLGALAEDDIFMATVPTDHYFREIFVGFLLPILQSPGEQELSKDDIKRETAESLIGFSLASLRLLVTDKPFDPALYPLILNDRHARRLRELNYSLEATRQVESSFTGQASNHNIRDLEQQISRLEQPPQSASVVRPAENELLQLNESFSNIIRVIIGKCPEKFLLPRFSDQRRSYSGSELEAAIRDLRAQVTQVSSRLAQLGHKYEDVYKPILWTLSCLSLGLDLLSNYDKENNSEHSLVHEMMSHGPFMGSDPVKLLDWRIKAATPASSDVKLRLNWLEHYALANSIWPKTESPSQTPDVLDLLAVVDSFYGEWLTQLEHDQKLAMTKSRYYTYRGEKAENEQDVDAEISLLFPSFEDGSRAGWSESVSKTYDARDTAVKLAIVHEQIFGHEALNTSLKIHILRVLDGVAAELQLAKPDLPLAPTESLLPALFLQSENQLNHLRKTNDDRQINIYADGDISEAKNMLKLVRDISRRFSEIQTAWPEHAVPAEVLSCCQALQELKLDDPIAKLLAKIEKLFAIVNEWNQIASREFSASELQGQLSSLIISWRRLELSSWSRLLDIEDQKCLKDAQAWFFIVYEALIVRPRRGVENNEPIHEYTEELVRTLEDFLNTTSIGQFEGRLRLIGVFYTLVLQLTEHLKSMAPIVDCVSNVLQHYRRYGAGIKASLLTGRGELEKEIQEQIKLASWRDVNINALRQSAQHSHRRLLRTIKKYRILLAKPFSSMSSGQSHKPSLKEFSSFDDVGNAQPSALYGTAIQQCQLAFHDWNDWPDRLTNGIGAATSMRTLYLHQHRGIDVLAELANFQKSLVLEMRTLKEQTPSKTDEESNNLVLSMKSRKRRLLADTMKSLYAMGVKRNLGAKQLEGQASTSKIFSCLPGRVFYEDGPTNDAFYQLVDLMPQVRKGMSGHSEDLSSAEARRGYGLLEGLLSVCCRQRTRVGVYEHDLSILRRLVYKLCNLGQAADDEQATFRATPQFSLKLEMVKQRLAWLSPLIDLSIDMLTSQTRRSQIDTSSLVGCLQRYGNDIRASSAMLDVPQTLPGSIIPAKVQQALQHAAQVMDSLNGDLNNCLLAEPRVGFILKKLIPWTTSLDAPMNDSTNGHQLVSLAEFNQSFGLVTAHVFAAMQRMAQMAVPLPQNIEEDPWLAQSEKHFNSSLWALNLNSITSDLSTSLQDLAHIESVDVASATSLLIAMTPIIEQYYLIGQNINARFKHLHNETSRMAVMLCTSFISLLNEGFCSPSDSADQKESGKVESGTGLGDGLGAEDISRDVGDDEDLSELAQGQENNVGDGEIEAAADAVDMGPDELKGQDDKSGELGDEDTDGETPGDDTDVEEKVDSVDNLDPSAVDEKLWEELAKEAQKELEGEKGKLHTSDEQTASDPKNKRAANEIDQQEDQEQERDENMPDEESGAVGREQEERVDPFTQEEDRLDLPEDVQFNGQENDTEDDMLSADGEDEMSDFADQTPDQDTDLQADADQTADELYKQEDEDDLNSNFEESGSDGEGENNVADKDMITEDQGAGEDESTNNDYETRRYDEHGDDGVSIEDKKGVSGESEDQANKTQNTAETRRSTDEYSKEKEIQGQASVDDKAEGDVKTGAMSYGRSQRDAAERQLDDTIKRVGNILEEWHQRREILTPAEDAARPETDDVDMADADFEHLKADAIEGDTQALGAATKEQAQALDLNKGIEDHQDNDMEDADKDNLMVERDEASKQSIAEQFSRLQTNPSKSPSPLTEAFLPERPSKQAQYANGVLSEDESADLERPDANVVPTFAMPKPLMNTDDAVRLWSQYSTSTHQMSLVLTEQLRRILAPTQATKLRGDFRTGKRLNIKRIIPYIASQYKRDKIWMRRSVPSKRSYQIMIAVDDSKSMVSKSTADGPSITAGGAGPLAFETLALLCKSLTMLEVGDICVVSFGNEKHVRLAHRFGQPFSSESGAQIYQNFSFEQTATNVKKLVAESIAIFQDARLKATQSQSDLWQLELIISDGICEDHEGIQKLVRAAADRKIMIVFVIVESADGSIMDLTQASFAPDKSASRRGEMKLAVRSYLETFPFPYYLVVRDVRDLPGVLATALKGWFAQVVDVQG